ncbi:hypothetical protein I79_024506 [Cricetulus griseus]|uniref:Uncharacterized protein n=1 Tax=Cricetulus griseus TaxID=10029 RepID=G3IKV2_CRIGR|nr:hypothetical protein I79_024506 [Cricetulus griseus]
MLQQVAVAPRSGGRTLCSPSNALHDTLDGERAASGRRSRALVPVPRLEAQRGLQRGDGAGRGRVRIFGFSRRFGIGGGGKQQALLVPLCLLLVVLRLVSIFPLCQHIDFNLIPVGAWGTELRSGEKVPGSCQVHGDWEGEEGWDVVAAHLVWGGWVSWDESSRKLERS